jgi:hypothetical protein
MPQMYSSKVKTGDEIEMFSFAKREEAQPLWRQIDNEGGAHKMKPRPKAEDERHRGSGDLHDKAAIITRGDSRIGRAVNFRTLLLEQSGPMVVQNCKFDAPLGP